MRALPKRLSLLSLSALVGAASFGCSFTKFDDLEDQAPGFRVKQDTSDGFGRPLVGLTRLNDEVGGTLFIAGTGGNPTLFTATFNAQGGMAGAQADREHFDDKLGLKGYGVRAMAAAPADKTLITENRPGPFVYVGATSAGAGRVIVVDINSYKPPLGGGVLSKNVSEFGTALAAAKWGNGGAEDLVVGATGAIFFLRANPWPNFTAAPDMGYSPGPNTTQVYSVVAAGDLDPTTPEDEVVAAAPDRNYVAVVYGVSSCFGGQRKTNDNKDGGSSDGASSDAGANDATTPDATTPDATTPDAQAADAQTADSAPSADSQAPKTDVGSTGDCSGVRHFQVTLPADANGFGAALLIADVDEDNVPELLIGAPNTKGGGAVYVYSLSKSDFDQDRSPTIKRTISAPEGVNGFGSSLAIGKFDGGAKRILAIGAPTSAQDGTQNAGKIVLYRTPDLGQVVNTLTLASAESADLLGAALTVMPFHKGDNHKEVLAASVKKGVVVFFANTTPEHADFRK